MVVGGITLLAAALAYALLLAALRGRGAGTDETRWWLAYALDATNLAAFLVFSGSYHLLGLPGPAALLAGASLTLIGYGLDHLLRSARLSAAALVVLALVSAALREPLARGLRALMRGLF